MKSEVNVLNHIQKHDRVVALALLQGIGNFALSNLISASQAEVYARIALENNPDENPISVDHRNETDDLATEGDREPPVGMAARETPMDRVKRYGPLYADCMEMARSLDGGQYDMPQDIESHVKWRMGQPARDAEKARRGQISVEEALRLASNAKAQQKFWAERAADVIAIATDASENEYEAALLELQGVDAVQAMIKGYGKLVDRIAFRKGSPYFTAKNTIGEELRSEVGAMEAALEVVAKFVDTLEREYARDLLDAIAAGRALVTLESQTEAVQLRLKERLDRILGEIEAADKKAATAA